ncbi:hypothetical protein RIR_jg38352.t1 [Rhizophagus irregularis DAOM 181602=DAOM 197198]|nr:hypothetical protein RIR_jg38352.t1 [Rhizophagus irregularis DAOM 181602=DAOM 197198]
MMDITQTGFNFGSIKKFFRYLNLKLSLIAILKGFYFKRNGQKQESYQSQSESKGSPELILNFFVINDMQRRKQLKL